MKNLRIKEFLTPNTVFLTGAGVSTDSGIPDYRGPRGVYTRIKEFKPITYQQFISSPEMRTRYWARSFMGWPMISSASPNPTHKKLDSFKKRNPNTKIITQNVDGLHTKAGVEDTIEMHGSLHRVKCLSCSAITSRESMQQELEYLNPTLRAPYSSSKNLDIASSNPDGDVEVSNYSSFKYPNCHNCNGILKPDVVFFGENITPMLKQVTYNAVENCTSLIVMGSSLTVFSSFRLVKMMHSKVPIVIVNLGATRADDLCDLKIEDRCLNILEYIN